MKEKSEHGGEPTPASGAAAKMMLRAIDTCVGWLNKLRSRFDAGGEDAGDRGREPAGRRGKRAEVETAAEAKPARPGFFLRGLLVGLLCLLVGGGAGAFLAYRHFAAQLAEHAGVVEGMREEIDVAHKEERRSVNLMARFQRENAEMRLQVREAEREAQDYKARVAELDKELAEARRPVRPIAPNSRSNRRATAPGTRAPEKTGDCAVGGSGAGDKLGECIEKFNRR